MTSNETLLVLLSAFLHALWNFSAKGSRHPVAFALVLRGILAVPLIALLPWFDPGEIPREVGLVLCASAVVHTLYLYWLAKGYQTGDLSLVYPIARSTPALIPLVAVPLLGESLSFGGGVGIAVVVAGIWLVHGETWRWGTLRHSGSGYALLTLGATVGYSLLDKQGMTTLGQAPWSGLIPRALVYLFILETAGFLLLLPLALRDVGAETQRRVARTELRSAHPATSALRASVAALASYALILEAFRTAYVSYVVTARQSSVLFALALGVIFMGERPSPSRLLGAIATMIGVALVALA